jgi:hypothetical protein
LSVVLCIVAWAPHECSSDRTPLCADGAAEYIVQFRQYWPRDAIPSLTQDIMRDFNITHDGGADAPESGDVHRWRLGPSSGNERMMHFPTDFVLLWLCMANHLDVVEAAKRRPFVRRVARQARLTRSRTEHSNTTKVSDHDRGLHAWNGDTSQITEAPPPPTFGSPSYSGRRTQAFTRPARRPHARVLVAPMLCGSSTAN